MDEPAKWKTREFLSIDWISCSVGMYLAQFPPLTLCGLIYIPVQLLHLWISPYTVELLSHFWPS